MQRNRRVSLPIAALRVLIIELCFSIAFLFVSMSLWFSALLSLILFSALCRARRFAFTFFQSAGPGLPKISEIKFPRNSIALFSLSERYFLLLTLLSLLQIRSILLSRCLLRAKLRVSADPFLTLVQISLVTTGQLSSVSGQFLRE